MKVIICTRSRKPGARLAAIEELSQVFARDSLKAVPSVLEWWEEETREKVVSLRSRHLRASLGLPPLRHK